MRRRGLARWLFRALRLGLAVLLVSACSTPMDSGRERYVDAPPGYEPALESDEAGLWMVMDEAEYRLKTSAYLVSDPELNRYVQDIVCRLAGPRCGDIRVYLMRIPHFNASMAPNGVMQVWTGLLLRAENEAQLAYVLGHEIGHYLRRHSIQMWRDRRQKTAMVTYLRVIAPMLGIPGYAMDLTKLGTLGTLLKFSRDAEREADEYGFDITTAAGYDPREAAKLWKALMKEREAIKEDEPWVFFQTHPPTEERIENLENWSTAWMLAGGHGRLGESSFAEAIDPWRMQLFYDELHLYQFKRSQVVLDRLFEAGENLGRLHFFQGELYRLRAGEEDAEKAVAAYRRALEHADAPAETYRNLGQMLFREGQLEEAQALFQEYLDRKPDAVDRLMVDNLLSQTD